MLVHVRLPSNEKKTFFHVADLINHQLTWIDVANWMVPTKAIRLFLSILNLTVSMKWLMSILMSTNMYNTLTPSVTSIGTNK
jgi:hypothetical protein